MCDAPIGMDCAWLTQNYLFGLPTVDNVGRPFPASIYENAICAGLEYVGNIVGIQIAPKLVEDENHDATMASRPYFQTTVNLRPLRSIVEVRLQAANYTVDQNPAWIFRVPPEWITILSPNNGLFEVRPTWALGGYPNWVGWWFALYPLANNPRVGGFVRVDYNAGFDGSAAYPLPDLVRQAVGAYAAAQAAQLINVLRGVNSSQSVSQDGLSQSRSTSAGTAQGLYGTYVAALQQRSNAAIAALSRKYRGTGLGSI